MSSPVITLAPQEAYQCWAATYDSTENPLIALEERSLLPLLNDVQGRDVLDIGCGTGRWLRHLSDLGARSLCGIDNSAAMLSVAKSTCSPSTKLHLADALSLPLPDASVDLVIGSFLLSYVEAVDTFIEEVHRVLRDGGLLLLSDLHPEARRHGWRSSFRVQESSYIIATYAYSLAKLKESLRMTAFSLDFCLEPYIGEAERQIFVQAGREDLFAAAIEHPAIFISGFRKQNSRFSARDSR